MQYAIKRKIAPRGLQIQKPAKIRSKVTVKNFRKFKPRILVEQNVPAVAEKKKLDLPQRTVHKVIDRVKEQPKKKPNPVPIRKPKAPPKLKAAPKPEKAPVAMVPVQAEPRRSLLRQQLSEIRRKAIERGQGLPAKRRNKEVRNKAAVIKNKAPINKKAIENLKNIGINRILVMIAAGPSVLEVDFTPILKNPIIDIMCINKPFQPVWPSKFWAFCDHTQQRANPDIWNRYEGIIINSPNVRARKSNQVLIRSRPGKGFNIDVVHGYHIGRSSTYANMQVAHYMSYRKIYLFGVDMGEVGGKLHHYGQNPDVTNENRKNRFPAEAQHYLWAARNLPKASRDRFVFCSSYNTWEFTQHFPKLDHKEAISEVLKYAQFIQDGG
jgi:hypothetical protein